MKVVRPGWLWALLPALFCGALFPLPAASSEFRWQTGVSLTYLNGDYGTDETTKMLYLPFTVRRYFERSDLSATIPYLSVKTTGAQVIIAGQAQTVGEGTDTPVRESGLGDIVLKWNYYLTEQSGPWPYLDVTVKLKVPTADEEKGLGTGEFDLGVGLDASYRFKVVHLLLADIAYAFVGEPEGAEYRNQLVFDVGYGYQVTEKMMLSAYYEFRNSLIETNPNPQSLMLYGSYRLRPDLRMDMTLDLGLSDGAADIMLTGGLYRYF
jgi:hypothetical protein